MKWGFRTCGPNQVMVVSGCCYPRPLLVPGGRVFIWPGLQKVQHLNLSVMNVILDSSEVLSLQGIPVLVTSVAQVKISNDKKSLRRACNLFLGMLENEMIAWFRDTLEGHQRTVIGKMTIEDIYFKRMSFASQFMKLSEEDMQKMGLQVVAFQIKSVKEKEGIIESILSKRSAEGKASIRIEQAEMERDSLVTEVQKDEDYILSVSNMSQELMAKEKNLELQKVSNEIEWEAITAIVDMTPKLQTVKCLQHLKREQMKDKVLETEALLEKQKSDTFLAATSVAMQMMNTDALVHAVTEVSRAENHKAIADSQNEASLIQLQTTIHNLSANNASLPMAIEYCTSHKKNLNDSKAIDIKATSSNMTNGTNDQETRKVFSAQDSLETGDTGDLDDILSVSSSSDDEPTVATVTLADGNEELTDIFSHVQDKVSQIVGVNLTNAIVKTVFQEVFELLK